MLFQKKKPINEIKKNTGYKGNKNKNKNTNTNKKEFVKVLPKKTNFKTNMNVSSSDNRLYFGALGGLGSKIGGNLYLYGTRGSWVIVDMGSSFPGDDMAGAEQVVPDSTFLKSIKGHVLGIFITHAHLDHIGSIPYIWEDVRAPIFATPFAIKVIENHLSETPLAGQIPFREVSKDGARFDLGPFDIEFFHITHSIPQANCIIIRTEAGNFIHTGDWKFDKTPLIDKPTDMQALKRLANDGVTGVMCDSTNAIKDGHTLSEIDAKAELEKVVRSLKTRKILITCFSTNIVRMQTIGEIAKSVERRLIVVGRSMITNINIAKSEGYLKNFDFLTIEEAKKIPLENQIILCTGTQGEARSVMTRISDNNYQNISVDAKDTIIFSSRIIPGNESEIFDVQNNFAKRGVNVITVLDNSKIHASGHACVDEITELYNILKPKNVIPVHGEPIHLFRNSKIAESLDISVPAILNNGEFIAFENGKEPKIVETVPVGEIIIDGTRQISSNNDMFPTRRKINYNGALFISLVFNKAGIVGKPEVSSLGVFETETGSVVKTSIINEARAAIKKIDKKELQNDEIVREAVASSARRVIKNAWDKKPAISVHIVRV